jgi:hypothetical protein
VKPQWQLVLVLRSGVEAVENWLLDVPFERGAMDDALFFSTHL